MGKAARGAAAKRKPDTGVGRCRFNMRRRLGGTIAAATNAR